MTETVHPQFAAGDGSFKHLKLGKLPKTHEAKIQLADYVDFEQLAALPSRPTSLDLTAGIVFPMYGNDRLGDCTCAAVGHMRQVWTKALGDPVTPSDAEIERLYIPETGTEDTGRVETDVLDYWKNTGLDDGNKILGYAAIRAGAATGVIDHMKLAIDIFGGVYTGIALPITAQSQAAWHVVGDPTDPNSDAYPGSWGGHAVPLGGYDPKNFTVITWGSTLKATNHWWQVYCDEAYAVLTQDWLNAQGKTPAGLDLAQLEADLKALA